MPLELPENWSELVAPLKEEGCIKVLKALRESGPLSLTQLSRSTNLAEGEAFHYLSVLRTVPKLVRDDYVEIEDTFGKGFGSVHGVDQEIADVYLSAVERFSTELKRLYPKNV